MIINHNMMAMNTKRQMGINQGNSAKSIEKLSSGMRINRAGDDAAGLAISEKMRGQIRGLNQASRNSQDGISMIQTAEGALNETQAILQRMRELAVQSANDTNTADDRDKIQSEVNQLAEEITRVSNDTEFNTQNVLGGNLNDKFQVGANKGQSVGLKIGAMDAQSLGVAGDAKEVKGTIKSASDIGSVDFGDSTGTKVVDTANLTFAYKTETADKTSKVTGKAYTKGDLKAAVGTMTITVGSDKFGITQAEIQKLTGSDNEVANAKTTLETAQTAGGKKLTDVAKITIDAGKLVIEAKTAGTDKIKVEVAGAGKSTIEGAFKLESANATTVDGVLKGDYITVSDGTDSKDFEVDKTKTTFSTGKDGDFGGVTLKMGTNKTLADLDVSGDVVTAAVTTVSSSAMSADGETKAVAAAGIDITSQTKANDAIETINTAITSVSNERSKLGAMQNRLEHTIKNLDTSSENLQAAESRIRDVDMAKEMMAFQKNNILSQAAQSMLAQANQAPQGVLQLLR